MLMLLLILPSLLRPMESHIYKILVKLQNVAYFSPYEEPKIVAHEFGQRGKYYPHAKRFHNEINEGVYSG